MYRPISDYAVIGNLRSAILISKDASIEWAPAPFIDSPSIFASILDHHKGGFWSITPTEPFSSAQKYIEGTNVLLTTFTTDRGVIEVTDFLPIETKKDYFPSKEDTTFRLHRRVVCTHGECPVQTVFKPRLDYARGKTILSYHEQGVAVTNNEKHGILASGIELSLQNHTAFGKKTMKEGESLYLVFRYNDGGVISHEEQNAHHNQELEDTIAFWRSWTHRCKGQSCPADGKWREEILRSELLLKILFFDPVGTVAAAPTTSLPEALGGVRNWDYRYTWVRDSAFIFGAFLELGHRDEAETYLDWLISKCFDSAKDSFSPMQIMYPLHEDSSLKEEILPHLEGYQHSKPVRIGNDAHLQKQWDVFGTVLDLIWQLYKEKNEPPTERLLKLIEAIADHVVAIWQEPDEGLWEVRGGAEHFTYSKVMCWVALDRAVKIGEKYHFSKKTELWEKEAQKIRDAVFAHSWNEELQSFTQSFDSDALDASLLLLHAVGFIKGTDPKMLRTIEAIQDNLKENGIYVKRYTGNDGLPGQEGAFLLSSFWLVDALISAERISEAEEIYEKLLAKSNHVGLYPEEINPETGAFLGNFPQAYTHIGLINSAFHLVEAKKKKAQYTEETTFPHTSLIGASTPHSDE